MTIITTLQLSSKIVFVFVLIILCDELVVEFVCLILWIESRAICKSWKSFEQRLERKSARDHRAWRSIRRESNSDKFSSTNRLQSRRETLYMKHNVKRIYEDIYEDATLSHVVFFCWSSWQNSRQILRLTRRDRCVFCVSHSIVTLFSIIVDHEKSIDFVEMTSDCFNRRHWESHLRVYQINAKTSFAV